MARAHIAVPEDLIEEVDRIVGPRRRSQFFVEAAREKVRRTKLVEAAESVIGSLRDVDIPGWESQESAAEWVRASRRADDRSAEASHRE